MWRTAVVIMSILACSAAFAADSDQITEQERDALGKACDESYGVCLETCKQSGTGFSADFKRINCEFDCGRAHTNCHDSIPIKSASGSRNERVETSDPTVTPGAQLPMEAVPQFHAQ